MEKAHSTEQILCMQQIPGISKDSRVERDKKKGSGRPGGLLPVRVGNGDPYEPWSDLV